MTEQSGWFERLAESCGPLAKLPNNGAAYHTGEQIVTHLNRVLGPENWSFHVLEMGQEEDSDECYCFGQITAIIDGQTVVKQDYGSQAFKRARSTGKYISKWDDKKSAATDALKRCARLLGVGLDAWANEKAPSWRPEIVEDDAPTPLGRSGATAAGNAAATPSATGAARSSRSSTDTDAAQKVHDSAVLTGAQETVKGRWSRLVKEAEAAQLPTLGTIRAIDAEACGEAQLKRHAERLEARLAEVKQGAA